MYKGNNGEFVEFTNVSGSAIDMTGWIYNDFVASQPTYIWAFAVPDEALSAGQP